MTDRKLESQILYFVAFILLGTLLILIFWMQITGVNQTIAEGKDERVLNIVDKIQIFTALGTFLAAVAASMSAAAAKKSVEITSGQLKEMKRQREDSQKPELLLGNTGLIPLSFPKEMPTENSIDIPLINLGNGAAIKVKATFAFEDNYLRNLSFNEVAKKSLNFQTELASGDRIRYSYNYSENVEVKSICFLYEDNNTEDIEIPYITKNNESNIKLPKSMKKLMDSICFIKGIDDGLKSPDVIITFTFEDFYMNTYKKVIKMRFTFDFKINDKEVERSYSLNPEIIK